MASRIVAVIPCLNEAKTIAQVVTKAKKYCYRVIVVDNMSVDRTVDMVTDSGADVYRCYVKGAGASTSLGLAYSLNPLKHLRGGIIVTLDGDGQHNPDDIPRLVAPIQRGLADITVGCRRNDDIPRYRYVGNSIIRWIHNIGKEKKIGDVTCGFRAFSRDALKGLDITEYKFGFLLEMLSRAKVGKLRVMDIPISCVYHESLADNSSMNPMTMGLSMAWAALKWRLKLELPNLLKGVRA